MFISMSILFIPSLTVKEPSHPCKPKAGECLTLPSDFTAKHNTIKLDKMTSRIIYLIFMYQICICSRCC